MSQDNQNSAESLIAAIEAYRNADYAERQILNNEPAKAVAVELRLDPAQLMYKLEKMRKEGVKPEVLRQAIQEALDEANGAPRTFARRVTKSDTMTPMPSQEEINKALFEEYKVEEKVLEIGSTDTSTSLKDIFTRLNEMAFRRKQAEAVINKPPTIKQRLYRAAYFVLRRPLNFMIKFMKALRGDYDDHHT